MSDSEDELICPLCVEDFDAEDKNFLPCPCGYRVCLFCWHHIREDLNGLCPACRTPYASDPHIFAAADKQEMINKKAKKMRDRQEKRAADTKSAKSSVTDRRLLHNYRVVQRNLIYVIGLPLSIATEESLRKSEYFGQYGKIAKIVIHKGTHPSSHSTVSAYVTFTHKEDARSAIQAIDGYWLDNSMIRASFGTTKYCNNFIKGSPCNNPDCVYLHEIGDDEDRYTKEEIQSGRTKIEMPVPGSNQVLVTGNGGPSGTGKKPSGEGVLPPPVFLQEIRPSTSSKAAANTWTSAKAPTTASATNTANGSATSATSNGAASGGSSPRVGPKSAQNEQQTMSQLHENISSDSKAASEIDMGSLSGRVSGLYGENSSMMAAAKYETISTNDNINNTNINNAVGNNRPENKTGTAASTTGADSKSTIDPSQLNNMSFEEAILPLLRLTSGPQNTSTSAKAESNRSVNNSATAFNGLGYSTVFPVPFSSLSISIWSNILTAPRSNDASFTNFNSNNVNSTSLETNPFGGLKVCISELLDLTLPPVDAMSNPPWPKPLAYYRQATGNDMGDVSYQMQQMQQLQQLQQQRLRAAMMNEQQLKANNMDFNGMNSNNNSGMNMNMNSAPNTSMNPTTSNYPSMNYNMNQTQNSGMDINQAPKGQQSIAMLKQIFPGVKLNIGSKSA